jgi:hypothetical protein
MRALRNTLRGPAVAALGRLRADPRLRRRVTLLVLAALLLAVLTADRPSAQPPLVGPVQVLSGYEQDGTVSLARDCGYSAPLPASPGRSLWLFCDTPVYVRYPDARGRASWTLQRFIPGSTAAVGLTAGRSGPAGRAPGPLSEITTPAQAGFRTGTGTATADAPTPGGAPEPFLPAPAGLITHTGQPCGADPSSYAASWVTGVTQIPATKDLLVTFNNFCVLSESGEFLPEGFGLAEYDPEAGTLSHETTVFSLASLGAAPSAKLLGSPVFSGRYLYLFGPMCRALAYGRCATGALFEARVPAGPGSWTQPQAYQWASRRSPGSWTSDATAATSIVAGARPSGVSVARFAGAGRDFVLVEQTAIDGAFTVYQAPTPVGPWKRLRSGRVPCRTGSGFANFCRAIIGHPELSTRSRLVLSYFNPAAGVHGHVMVAGFRW